MVILSGNRLFWAIPIITMALIVKRNVRDYLLSRLNPSLPVLNGGNLKLAFPPPRRAAIGGPGSAAAPAGSAQIMIGRPSRKRVTVLLQGICCDGAVLREYVLRRVMALANGLEGEGLLPAPGQGVCARPEDPPKL
jgi:hypothetical protein